MSLLGIDVGTGGCKVAAYSEDGCRLALAYREYSPSCPKPGWAELPSNAVLDRIWDAIAEVNAAVAHDPAVALSVSSLGEAMTPVSAERRPIGNSILCSDARGGEYLEFLRTEIGGQNAFYMINPNILAPNYSLPKLMWMRDRMPEMFRDAWKFMLWGDLVIWMMGAEPMTDFSLANRTLMFDIQKEDWSDRLLGLAGITREQLPTVVQSGTVAGEVSGRMARQLGFKKRVKIVVGGHDQCCNALGAGVFEAGRAVCGMGTFQCVTPVFDGLPDRDAMLAAGLNIEHHVVPKRFVCFLFNQAGALVRWFRDTFAAGDQKLAGTADIYDALLEEMPPEPTRLIVLPAFESGGSPRLVHGGAGLIGGLRASTTRGEILKAIMEGVSMYFVEGLKALKRMGMNIREMTATGGGAKGDAWLQIQADVLGIPIARLRETEASAAGAAMLAGMGSGVFSRPEDAAALFVREEKVIEPDAARHSFYAERHRTYEELLRRTEDLFRNLGG